MDVAVIAGIIMIISVVVMLVMGVPIGMVCRRRWP